MNYILGICCNKNSFPSIQVDQREHPDYRVSIASYALKNNYPTVIKNIKLKPQQARLDDAIYQGKHNGQAIFLCSYHPQYPERSAAELPPLLASFSGRSWSFVGQLYLQENFKEEISLNEKSILKPIGNSDQAYIFCWLLQQIFDRDASNLAEFTWQSLHELFQQINNQGPIDILFSDGEHVVAYHGYDSPDPFYRLQIFPGQEQTQFHFNLISVNLTSADAEHSLIVFSNQESSDDELEMVPMQFGQMIASKQGAYLWDSLGIIAQVAIESPLEMQDVHNISAENPLIISQVYRIPLRDENDAELSSVFGPVYITSNSPDPHPTIYYIHHDSNYHYGSPIGMSKHLFRLQPTHDLVQNLISYKLSISVNGKHCNFSGAFGNSATLFDINEPYTDLCISSQALVTVSAPPKQRYDLLHQQFSLPLIWMPWDQIMMQAYLTPPELPESELFELSDYAMSFVKRNNSYIFDVLQDINRSIYHDYVYSSGATTLATTPFDVYLSRHGVCQDFANLFICLARLLNIPARYRVGYIYTGTDYSNKEQGDATHAWVELYLPNIGWMGFDPTNCCTQSKNHIRVASGRNYRDATPTSGTIFKGGGDETLHTSVQVIKLTVKELEEKLSEQETAF